jgi:hypothetical protein
MKKKISCLPQISCKADIIKSIHKMIIQNQLSFGDNLNLWFSQSYD